MVTAKERRRCSSGSEPRPLAGDGMTTNINVSRVRALLREIVAEANWVIGELSSLQKEGRDEGRAPDIEPLYKKILLTSLYDARTELDAIEDRLNGSEAGDPATSAKLMIGWLFEDSRPLVELPETSPDAEPSLLSILLITGSGEIVNRINAIYAELAPLTGYGAAN